MHSKNHLKLKNISRIATHTEYDVYITGLEYSPRNNFFHYMVCEQFIGRFINETQEDIKITLTGQFT